MTTPFPPDHQCICGHAYDEHENDSQSPCSQCTVRDCDCPEFKTIEQFKCGMRNDCPGHTERYHRCEPLPRPKVPNPENTLPTPPRPLLYGAKTKVDEIRLTLEDMARNGLRGDLPHSEAIVLLAEIERLTPMAESWESYVAAQESTTWHRTTDESPDKCDQVLCAWFDGAHWHFEVAMFEGKRWIDRQAQTLRAPKYWKEIAEPDLARRQAGNDGHKCECGYGCPPFNGCRQ